MPRNRPLAKGKALEAALPPRRIWAPTEQVVAAGVTHSAGTTRARDPIHKVLMQQRFIVGVTHRVGTGGSCGGHTQYRNNKGERPNPYGAGALSGLLANYCKGES
jgi:hypothetical protein